MSIKGTSSISITITSCKRQKTMISFFTFVGKMTSWLVYVKKHQQIVMVAKFPWEGIMTSQPINMELPHTCQQPWLHMIYS